MGIVTTKCIFIENWQLINYLKRDSVTN